MHTLLFSIFASVVPARYYGRLLADSDVNVQRGAVVSGTIQAVGLLAVLVFRYITFIHLKMATTEEAVRNTGRTDKFDMAASTVSSGYLGFFEYIFHPVTIIILYFAFEGVIRIYAAVVTNEVLPSLPFQLASWMHSLVNRQSHRSFLGPRIADVVTEVDTAKDHVLRIESCRTKPWDMMMTISYNELLYELVEFMEQGLPRRFVYLLRRIPTNKLIRGLHHYDPNEELTKED